MLIIDLRGNLKEANSLSEEGILHEKGLTGVLRKEGAFLMKKAT